jgi:uncharacterized protein YggE
MNYVANYPKFMGTASKATPPEIAVFTLKVERSKLERFREVADANHRSMAQQLRLLIDLAVSEFEQNGEAA